MSVVCIKSPNEITKKHLHEDPQHLKKTEEENDASVPAMAKLLAWQKLSLCGRINMPAAGYMIKETLQIST